MTTEKTLSERLVELSAFYAERPAVNQEFRSPEMVEISMRECADLHVILKEAATALSGRVSDADMAAFGASEYAAYKYPGEHQVAERAAFCEGAALQASLPARGDAVGFKTIPVTDEMLRRAMLIANASGSRGEELFRDVLEAAFAMIPTNTLPASGGSADALVEALKRVTDHLETWARDHSDERTAETDAAIFCAREALSRYDQALSAPTGWRGIESAPKDGTEVLVFDAKTFVAVHGAYYSVGLRGERKGWRSAGYPTGTELSLNPTHWMPLPPPPASKSASDTTPQEQGHG